MVKYKKWQKNFAKLLEVLVYIFTLTFFKKKHLSDQNIRYESILIIEPYGLGDCVYLEMTIRYLLSSYPDTKFYVWCNLYWFPLFNSNGKVTTIDSNYLPIGKNAHYSITSFYKLFKILSLLKKNKIDLGIDFRGDIRNQILLKLANVKELIGYKQYIGSDLKLNGYLLSRTVDYEVKQRLEQYADIVKSCNQFRNIDFSSVVNRNNSNLGYDIIINFGAGWKFRLWKKDKWESLIKRFENKFRILIISAPNEIELFDEFSLETKKRVSHKVTQNINEVNELLSFSKIFLGVDSGVLHLAARLGMPILGLYGSGNIEIWKPSMKDSVIIHKQEYFSCAPCRQVNCIFPNSNCMDAISVEEVYEAVIKLFKSIN